MNGRPGRQRGVALVAAIFLIVVVALLAGFLVSMLSASRTASAYAAVEARARYAAQSGLDWAAHHVLSNPATADCSAFPASFTLTGGGSGGFRVTVQCSRQAVTEGAVSYAVFDLEILAEFGTAGGDDYFRRVLDAAVVVRP
ncbi:MAG: hypothetical protein H6977_04730 [Gammaproteobacteria bacterium]|nr:hypothetical protein [Gammaproteobacteria bacterium]MCP5199292.1 hypothetical protein [Gammaproteobacteria bacterium]